MNHRQLKVGGRVINRNPGVLSQHDHIEPDHNQQQQGSMSVHKVQQMGTDKSEISRETSFVNDLNADSLDTVELVMEFEDEFDINIPDEEAEKIASVGDAITYIQGRI
jgi:acyl carrier protein